MTSDGRNARFHVGGSTEFTLSKQFVFRSEMSSCDCTRPGHAAKGKPISLSEMKPQTTAGCWVRLETSLDKALPSSCCNRVPDSSKAVGRCQLHACNWYRLRLCAQASKAGVSLDISGELFLPRFRASFFRHLANERLHLEIAARDDACKHSCLEGGSTPRPKCLRGRRDFDCNQFFKHNPRFCPVFLLLLTAELPALTLLNGLNTTRNLFLLHGNRKFLPF